MVRPPTVAFAALLIACGGDPTTGPAWVPTASGNASTAADDDDDPAPPDDDEPADDDDGPGDTGVDPTIDPPMDLGPPPTPLEAFCNHLETAPPPTFVPGSLVDWWEAFATTYANRSHGASNNGTVASYLASELEAAGYSADVLELSSGSGTVRVVEGIKLGTELPNVHVGFAAHYDSISSTNQGAYDNASGVAVQLQLCRALAHVDTRKSIACLFFDAEEIGRVGSERYVAQFVETGAVEYDQVFGYDMVGLNYPAMPWKLYASLGLETASLEAHIPSHVAHINTALFECMGDVLGLSDSGFELIEYYDKRSDEVSFMDANIPILRFTGGRDASDYNGYHNTADTVSNVLNVAGSRDAFERGMGMVVSVSYYSALAFDLYDPLALPEL